MGSKKNLSWCVNRRAVKDYADADSDADAGAGAAATTAPAAA